MARALRRHSLSNDAEVDMTPMLDIVFIMLIFFIVTATFMDEQGINLIQPPDGPKPATTSRAVEVYIGANNTVIIEGRAVDTKLVAAKVEALMSDGTLKSVILRSHNDANLKAVIGIKDELDGRGVSSVLKVEPS